MSEPKALYVLLAPLGQLSANGQLRETVQERRKKQGEDVPLIDPSKAGSGMRDKFRRLMQTKIF